MAMVCPCLIYSNWIDWKFRFVHYIFNDKEKRLYFRLAHKCTIVKGDRMIARENINQYSIESYVICHSCIETVWCRAVHRCLNWIFRIYIIYAYIVYALLSLFYSLFSIIKTRNNIWKFSAISFIQFFGGFFFFYTNVEMENDLLSQRIEWRLKILTKK